MKSLESSTNKLAGKTRARVTRVRQSSEAYVESLQRLTDSKGHLVNDKRTRDKIRLIADKLSKELDDELDVAASEVIELKQAAFKREKNAVAKELDVTVRDSKVPERALGVSPFQRTGRNTRDFLIRSLLKAVSNEETLTEVQSRLNRNFRTVKSSLTMTIEMQVRAGIAEGRLKVFKEAGKEGLIDGYIWDATLDARTSDICRELHGTFFPLGTVPPGPPAHYNCRSVLRPHFVTE